MTAEKCLRSVLISRDGGAGCDERLVEGDGVGERDVGIERQIEERAAAAADEVDDEGIFRCAAQQAQRVRAARKESRLGSGWPPA